MVSGTRGAVSSGHHLATGVGTAILRRGGNAFDAAAGVGFALTVVQPHQNGIGGEVPILIRTGKDGKTLSLSGHGTASKAATLEYFLSLGINRIAGDGFLPAVVPPAPATWIRLLKDFGTLRLRDVLEPAVALARDGFPTYGGLHGVISGVAERFASEWPTSASAFMPGGKPVPVGGILRQPDLASMYEKLLAAEAGAKGREAGLAAAHERFYRGDIAEAIVKFSRGTKVKDANGIVHAGLLTMEDLAGYETRIEEPVRFAYHGIEVLKCGPWTQGPVLLQALSLLAGYEIAAMGHNSADYIHILVEAMKLAYADREFYYGDPAFVGVPFNRLLSEEYARARRKLIDPKRASLDLRPGSGEVVRAKNVRDVEEAFSGKGERNRHGDTTKLDVMDSFGNVISATPSGGWLQSSPVVAGLGFPLGTRGQMFSLVPGHPNCLMPGKRPRTTLTPSLAMKEGKPYLSFGSPGGDAQDQWALEFFLNVVHFGMSLQEAVEAPTVTSCHWPSSFYPRNADPGVLDVEDRIPEKVRDDLRGRGHGIVVRPPFSNGNTMAVGYDAAAGVFCGAASPRYELAYSEAL